ncbi:MAG: PAS domain S-box protein [Candidatus Omnitrophica bacterium]|nr:PAS domain S-box protein [Candidatus Omnitrophota bacterium]
MDCAAHTQEVNDPNVGVPLLVTVSPIKNKAGEVIGAVHIAKDISGIKKAEQALEESRLRYKGLFDSSMDAIMLLVPEKGFIAGNPATVKIFRCKDEAEFTTKTPAELSPKYQPDGEFSTVKAQKMMAMAMERGSHFFEWVHKRMDGEEFDASVLLTRMELEGKTLLQATVRDITLEKKAEDALRESRAWLSVTLASIGDGVITTDNQGRITFMNQIAQNLTGWNEEEAIKLPLEKVFSILNEDSGKVIENPVARVLREKKIILLGNHTILITKNGNRLPIDDSAAPIKDKEGNIIGVVLIFRDVTSRRKNEEEMRRLASIVESSDDAIIGKVLDGTLVSWNRGAERLYGYSAKEAIGKNIKFLLPADRKDEFNDIIERIKKGERIERFETVRVKKDGGQIDVSLTISPIYNSIGKVIGASAIARDISAAKSLSRLKDEFISTVSHELRTPLSITKEGISIILDRIAGEINKKQQDILGTARDNIDRLARVIDSLLDISRIEAGKLELQRKMININGLITSVASSFEQKIKARGLTLNLKLPKEEIQAYADKDKLVQVFTNLIGNSLKFTEKGFIEIGAEKKKDEIDCYVLDSGIGISREELPKAFSKFEQFGRKPGVGEKGTGLGLSIVKGIIEKHKGRIWAESELGKGSKFSFTLPFYTYETLFKEHLAEGVRQAQKKETKLSLIIVSLVNFDKIRKSFPEEKALSILRDAELLFKDSLRREGDTVIKDTGEILILLPDCDKPGALIVRGRLEQAWDSYLAQKKLPDELKLQFSAITYPDQAKDADDLSKKARL